MKRKAIQVRAVYTWEKGCTTINAQDINGRYYCTKKQVKNALDRIGAAVGDYLTVYDKQYTIYVLDNKGKTCNAIT